MLRETGEDPTPDRIPEQSSGTYERSQGEKQKEFASRTFSLSTKLAPDQHKAKMPIEQREHVLPDDDISQCRHCHLTRIQKLVGSELG